SDLPLDERSADLLAPGKEECIRHAAANEQRVDPGDQVLQDGDLVRHLGAADDRGEGALRMLEELAECLNFLLHEEAEIGGEVVRDASRRCMSAMCSTEGIVHVDVAKPGESFGKFGVVLFLAGVEPQVLEQGDVTVT